MLVHFIDMEGNTNSEVIILLSVNEDEAWKRELDQESSVRNGNLNSCGGEDYCVCFANVFCIW